MLSGALEVSDALQNQPSLWSGRLGQSSQPPFSLVFHKMFPGGQISKCLRIESCFTENRNAGLLPLELCTVHSAVSRKVNLGRWQKLPRNPLFVLNRHRSEQWCPSLLRDVGRRSIVAWVSHKKQVRWWWPHFLYFTFGDRSFLRVCNCHPTQPRVIWEGKPPLGHSLDQIDLWGFLLIAN